MSSSRRFCLASLALCVSSLAASLAWLPRLAFSSRRSWPFRVLFFLCPPCRAFFPFCPFFLSLAFLSLPPSGPTDVSTRRLGRPWWPKEAPTGAKTIVAGALFFKPPLRRRGGLKIWPKLATHRRLRQAKRARSDCRFLSLPLPSFLACLVLLPLAFPFLASLPFLSFSLPPSPLPWPPPSLCVCSRVCLLPGVPLKHKSCCSEMEGRLPTCYGC